MLEKFNQQHLTYKLSLLAVILLLGTISVTVNKAVNRQDSRSNAQGKTSTYSINNKQLNEISRAQSSPTISVIPDTVRQNFSEDTIKELSALIILVTIILATVKLMKRT